MWMVHTKSEYLSQCMQPLGGPLHPQTITSNTNHVCTQNLLNEHCAQQNLPICLLFLFSWHTFTWNIQLWVHTINTKLSPSCPHLPTSGWMVCYVYTLYSMLCTLPVPCNNTYMYSLGVSETPYMYGKHGWSISTSGLSMYCHGIIYTYTCVYPCTWSFHMFSAVPEASCGSPVELASFSVVCHVMYEDSQALHSVMRWHYHDHTIIAKNVMCTLTVHPHASTLASSCSLVSNNSLFILSWVSLSTALWSTLILPSSFSIPLLLLFLFVKGSPSLLPSLCSCSELWILTEPRLGPWLELLPTWSYTMCRLY